MTPRRAQRLWAWMQTHAASVVLIFAGALMVSAALWIVPNRQAVATSLVVLGAGCIVLGAVLHRVEGPVALGPEGLKLVLKAVGERAAKRGLSLPQVAEAQSRAIDLLVNPATAGARPGIQGILQMAMDALPAAPAAEAIAEAVVAQVEAKEEPGPSGNED